MDLQPRIDRGIDDDDTKKRKEWLASVAFGGVYGTCTLLYEGEGIVRI
jgi:hypothetical protein